MAREQLKTLTEQMYYIMLALRHENFGYGIMEEVKKCTGGRVEIGAGTLYALLARFEKEKIICCTREEDRKRYYRLDEKGEQMLKDEYRRLKQLILDGEELEEAK
ncbi:MAG: helix-turn-helix transcriptional regulator [Erysipelotrichaceae bacterium]|nr:helix-turn-helix transcriptional regulator [Erysipelotrichaceae bacterium]